MSVSLCLFVCKFASTSPELPFQFSPIFVHLLSTTCCCNSQASTRLETTSRKTQPDVAPSHCIGSETTEHRSFLRVEEGSLSRRLAFDCGHGYAQEEYAVKRDETVLTSDTTSLSSSDDMRYTLPRITCIVAAR